MARLAPPTMTAYIGPCWLRNISIVFDFVAGHYSANGEWYVGAAISEVAEISAGPVGGAMLWWIEPPIPLIWVSLEGGLRLTLRASGLGGLQSTQTLAYDSGLGSIQFLTTNSLQLGSMFEADLDGYVSFSVYDTQICQWVWPLEHWETGTAAQYDLPINIGYGTGGPPVTIGPVTSAPIPYEDIEVAIDRRRPGTTCISLDDVIAWLCSMGLLPPTVCPSTVGPVTPGVLGDGEYPIVYRGGSAGRKNLTPRPVADPTGLSTFEKLEPATPPGGKAQMIDTTKFTELKGVQDPPPDYHVSITPGTAEKVAEWAATRDDESVPEHRWTKEVRAAIVKEVKRPK
jgi:hypothetical protein